jgi:hypothetical protein
VSDVELFMHDVLERPSILDSYSQEYSNRLKNLEICRIHYTDFDELDGKKQRYWYVTL